MKSLQAWNFKITSSERGIKKTMKLGQNTTNCWISKDGEEQTETVVDLNL